MEAKVILKREKSGVRARGMARGLGVYANETAVFLSLFFYFATVVSSITYVANSNLFWFRFAYAANVLGVVVTFFIAVPSFVDWALGFPFERLQKRYDLPRLAIGCFGLILFATSAFMMAGGFAEGKPEITSTLVFSVAGFICTLGGNWKPIQRPPFEEPANLPRKQAI